jgi:hypothetical protein
LFAGLMMIMVGIWQALEGLIAIFENEFYVATRNYLFQFDATTWAGSTCCSGCSWPSPAGGCCQARPGPEWWRSPWRC